MNIIMRSSSFGDGLSGGYIESSSSHRRSSAGSWPNTSSAESFIFSTKLEPR
uniref:Uncharacterized protein n=1 Tax=uncultured marine virus TaxID=186617 RepID=A0A0F7LAD7_9VIRU|nr:hypothetical protein [uncultured marine virus]